MSARERLSRTGLQKAFEIERFPAIGKCDACFEFPRDKWRCLWNGPCVLMP